jgi:hypothetical protein
MIVYLVGKEGCRSAIKVTTSNIYSNIDGVILSVLDKLEERFTGRKEWMAGQSLTYLLEGGYYTPKVYWEELDSRTGIKLLSPKMWAKVILEYVDRKGTRKYWKVLQRRNR